MKNLEPTTTGTRDAGFDLSRGSQGAKAIVVPNDCDYNAAVASLIDMIGRARWCERGDHRDPEDLDNLPGINPTDFAAEWPWVAERFRYFSERSIPEVEAAADDIEAATRELRGSQMGALDSVQSEIIDWSGKAKDAFEDGFVVPLASKGIAEQQRVLGELQAAMWAYDVVLRQARANAYELAKKSTEVVEAAVETDSSEAKIGLGILAVVIGVIGTVVSGGTGDLITLGLMNAGLSAVSTGIDAIATVGGDTVGEVMDSLLAALDQLTVEMNGAEQAIADNLTATLEAIEGDLRSDKSTLLPAAPENDVPDLTHGEMPSKDTFHQKT